MTELSIIDRLERLMHDLRLEYQEYIELREIRYEVERLQAENAALSERLERALEIAAHDSLDYAPEDAIEQAEKELAWAENESLKKNQKGGDNK